MATSPLNRHPLSINSGADVTDLAALTAAAAAGSTPTQAEFGKVVDDLTAIHATLADLVDALTS